MSEQYGERIAALEATLRGQNDLLHTILSKLDGLESLIRGMVTREDCREARAALMKNLDALETEQKEGSKRIPNNLASRLLALEGRTPAIIQYVVVGFLSGGVFWVLGKLFP